MGSDFRKLKIFHLSYQFLLEIYGVLPLLPEIELRNVYSQMQRAATSSVLNIVEGASNRSNKVFLKHIRYSYGSCQEVEVILMLCLDLNYIPRDVFEKLSSQLEELKASLFLLL